MGILLLSILKIVGIILLGILLLVFLLLIMILFIPVRYCMEGSYQSEALVKGQITWLFHVLNVKGGFDKTIFYRVRIFVFSFLTSEEPSAKKAKNRPNKDRKKEEQKKTEPLSKAPSVSSSQSNKDFSDDALQKAPKEALEEAPKEVLQDVPKEAFEEEPKKQLQEEASPRIKEDNQSSDKNKKSKKEKKRHITFRSRIRKIYSGIEYKIRSAYAKMEDFWSNLSFYVELLQKDETMAAFSLCKVRIFKIIRSILPRKLNVNMIVGTGEVYYTAQILSIQGLLYPLLGEHISIVPDFEEKRIEGNFYLKGRITFAVVILNAIIILLNRNIRNLLKQIKGGTQNDRK